MTVPPHLSTNLPRSSRALIYLLPLWSCLVLLIIGCAPRPNAHSPPLPTTAPAAEPPSAEPERNRIYEDVDRVFEKGVFYKPLEESAPDAVFKLAPLIVQEMNSGGGAATSAHLTGLSVSPDGSIHRDAARLAVYYAETTAQLTFLWWLDCDDDCPIDQRWRAIRATIGPDGFPLIWEIMGDDRDLCVLYVSRTLEDAAAERERPPPKRRFAAESALGATPSALIARVMDDGPMPMGPFVYLAREDARITTLLCRCSPSQFRDLPETKYFELRPLDNLRTAIKEVGGPDNLTESFFANLKSPSPCGHGGPNLSYLLRFAKPELP